MPDAAVRLEHVSKVYRLYGSQRDQLLDLLGLGRNRIRPAQEFKALDEVSLVVPRGHRVGIVGRNGAGKTTLLKLISGNFAPTSGRVRVTGSVQALLGMGLGFHPEFTGLENAKSALQYNGLSKGEYDAALDDIVEFCELGQFLNQPYKTYSLGMQARLMFAAATAVRPDILIVDEVLGAGDAYFVAKSKLRVERLVANGCTMLLVSHSTQQVLELCRDAIWLDRGRVRLEGDAFSVVKAYEEHIYGATHPGDTATGPEAHVGAGAPAAGLSRETLERAGEARLQEPYFLPHSQTPQLPEVPFSQAGEMRFQAAGGISRWASDSTLKVSGFSVVTERGEGNTLLAMRPARFTIFLVAEVAGRYSCRYGLAIHNLLGTCLCRIFSPVDRFEAPEGGLRRVELTLNPNQIGPGDYTLGISVVGDSTLEQVNGAARYDLLSRSFALRVELQDSLGALAAEFIHTAEWAFASPEEH